MSADHPIIAVTGSSGSGTSTARLAFEHMFRQLGIDAQFVGGDSFHAFDRANMKAAVERATIRGENFSHFGPGANQLEALEELFRQYGESGTGQIREYLHTRQQAETAGQEPGTFTPWRAIRPHTDLLFYEGLHGAMQDERHDIASHVDLAVGMVPTINLEWIQKIHRDTGERGYDPSEVTQTILRRMYDYVHFITPQFSHTDINFQRVPTVDTSNPFIARDVPGADESFVVIHIRKSYRLNIDFPYLLAMIDRSFMSRHNTIVVPGGRLRMAMEIILRPLLSRLIRTGVYRVE